MPAFIYPVILYLKSTFVVYNDGIVRLYTYSKNYNEVSVDRIRRIKKVLLNTMYKMEFLNKGDKMQVVYFFSDSSLWNESNSVKQLKAMCENLENKKQ